MGIIAVVMVFTAEIWVVRSESGPSSFQTWDSRSSSNRRIQKSKEIRETGVLQAGDGRAPVWLWFLRQAIYVFLPGGIQQCEKCLFSRFNLLLRCWELLPLCSWGILVSIFFHFIPLSGLVSWLHWSHRLSQQLFIPPLFYERVCV